MQFIKAFACAMCLMVFVSLPSFAEEQEITQVTANIFNICSVDYEKLPPTEKSVDLEHGGGLNACGCHFNRKTGECHCHRPRACGCACQPSTCK
ncbi:MAG TPA: hypothetical protein VFK88_06185 [Gallionella sp.]|nr:hypothetical protein [Gallionella sp.]